MLSVAVDFRLTLSARPWAPPVDDTPEVRQVSLLPARRLPPSVGQSGFCAALDWIAAARTCALLLPLAAMSSFVSSLIYSFLAEV